MKAVLRIMTILAALTVLVQLEALFSALDPVVSFSALLAAVGFAAIWVGINEAEMARNPTRFSNPFPPFFPVFYVVQRS